MIHFQPPPAQAVVVPIQAPTGFGEIKAGCCYDKFSETHLDYVFQSLAKRAGSPLITAELQAAKGQLLQYYIPYIKQFGLEFLNECPQRLLLVSQICTEAVLPVLIGGIFFLLNANTAAFQLTGLKTTDIGPASQTKKFIFDILHPEDAIPFVKKSIHCLANGTVLDRMKVRVVTPAGDYCQCVISESIHKDTHHLPLFSSFAITRIDDI